MLRTNPGRSVTAQRLAIATLLLGVTAAPAAAAPSSKPLKSPSAPSALSSLVRQTNAIPKGSIPASKKATLLRNARKAQSSRSSKACVSVSELASFRRTLTKTKLSKGLKGKKRSSASKKLALVGPTSMNATRALLRSSATKSCGGGKKASTVATTAATVMSEDVNGMTVRVQLPELRFVPETAGGQQWTRLALPDTDTPGAPGTPGIPVSSSMLGIPDGATYTVEAKATSSYTLDGVNVYPVQDDPVDQSPAAIEPKPNFTSGEFVNDKFDLTPGAYKQKGLVPAAPASGKSLGQSRDLTIGTLELPAAQYDAAADKLKVLQTVDVKVKFTGGKGFTGAIGSPWETAQNRLAGSLLNKLTVGKFREPPLVFQPCGEEMLVITNPTTRPSANTFATAKRAQGYLTRVVETGAAPNIGTTTAQIQTFIRSHLNSANCIRPSYITIIGDDELVPTDLTGPSAIPSDNPYSTKNNDDELPDVAVGRIIGNNAAQIDTAIAKIIGYENTPPAGAMLSKATLAAQFQDTDEDGEVNDGREDRTFIQFAETVRNGLVARGVTVDRIYDDNPTTNPTHFNDGSPLPASLQKPTFPWDGDGADVSAAWNEGRFLMIHRDHGWSDGWGDPFFTTTEVDALTNGANLPVVMSINCASAAYDTDETSFVQNALVKANGGSVGVFGDTRNSPSWHNSQIGLGFVDALLPSVLGGEGPATKQRVGDALVHGKLRLSALAPPSGPGIVGGDGNTRKELYLWHYFGDPSMKMWGGGSPPIVFNPAVFKAVYKELPIPKPGDPPPYEVNVAIPGGLAGQPFSLLRNGEVIGKALAGDGSVKIAAEFNDGLPQPGELEVAFDGDDAVPVKFPVEGGAAPKPKGADLVVTLTASQVIVKNQGDVDAPASSTTVSEGANTLTLPTPALAAGASTTLAYDCAKLGPKRTAKADSAGVVTESDETNNTASGEGLTCPDLVVTGITAALGANASTVTVKNQGAGKTVDFKVSITNTTGGVVVVDFGGLDAGVSATRPWTCASGSRGYDVLADSTSLVFESNEANNLLLPGNTIIGCPTT